MKLTVLMGKYKFYQEWYQSLSLQDKIPKSANGYIAGSSFSMAY
jgi:hypothetical protein